VVFSYEKNLIGEESFIEQQNALFKELNTLSPRQKEIVYLKFYNELSYQEIAEVTSLNYQSVRNYMHQALMALRKKKSLLAAIYTLACLLVSIF
jgi:RNA polymerase sigma-70 factor (ECF subfamily)